MGVLSSGKTINNIMSPITSRTPKLSKTRFITGLQCLKALHLTCYHYDLKDPLSEEQKRIFTQGTNIGIYAQQVYPGGILINETHQQIKKAIQRTKEVMENAKIGDSIYEAAFEEDGIVVRADIMTKQNDDEWDLIEVKSSASVKDVNIRDVGIQIKVIENSGINIREARLMHMSPQYNYQNPNWDNPSINFEEKNIGNKSREFADGIPELIKNMKEILKDKENIPDVKTGPHCSNPYKCSFWGYCNP